MTDLLTLLRRPGPWWRRLAWSLAVLGTTWLALWWLAPGPIQEAVQTRASAALGRQVTVGAVQLHPWSLELRLHDVAVAQSNAAQPQASVREIRLNLSWTSLWHGAPVLDAVTVQEPRLWLTRLAPGRYDIDDIVQRLTAPAASPPGEPTPFAVYNIRIQGGALELRDQPAARVHKVQDLQLTVPFLSNLAAQREVTTTPHLAFRFNGAAFDSDARTLPFAATHKTDVDLRLQDLDLAPYLPYLPAGLPLRPTAGHLDADLKLAFEQGASARVKLSGTVQLRQAQLTDAKGQESLRFDALRLGLQDVRPLERLAHLSQLEWVAPRLQVQRTRAGQINLIGANNAPTGTTDGPAAHAWHGSIAHLTLRDGRVDWQDDMVRSATGTGQRLSASALQVQADGLVWPMATPVQFQGEGKVSRDASANGASTRFSGQASQQAAQLRLNLAQWPLNLAAPYLAQGFQPEVEGLLDAELQLDWAAPAQGTPERLVLAAPQLQMLQVGLRQASERPLTVQQVQWRGASIDLTRHSVRWDSLTLTRPTLRLDRTQDGQWMFEHWLPTASPQPPVAAPATPWQVQGGELQWTDGQVALLDRSTQRPVRLNLSLWQLRAQNLGTAPGQWTSLNSSMRVGSSSRQDPGQLTFAGKVQPWPLALQGALEARRVPAHALAPYGEKLWHADLLRADTSFNGQLRYAMGAGGHSLDVQGDSRVEDLRLHARNSSDNSGNGEELLIWKLLALRGLQVHAAPGQALRVEVGETVLSDFFARMVVNAQGQLNLLQVLRTGAPAPVAPAPSSAPVAQVRLGPTTLLGGRVDFTDHYVQPNYSADLTELTGRLGALASGTDAPRDGAELELRGRAQGTASLEVRGRLNPLARPVTLDITGKVRDLELPPLSPYAIKYAGHGIERGKLSVDVAYKVQSDGLLTASNQLVLNQLRFGEAVAGAPNSLPVSLAVALLADRNGVIDIKLPVSGSLNDPQFSLGPVIWKVVVNLVGKALTSPFALLSAALGESSETLSTVGFEPGSARLEAPARQALDKVSLALLERPALTLSVVGTASLEQERDAFKRAQLGRMIEGERRRENLDPSAAGTAAPADEAAYARLLRTVYRRADIPKPRNFLGLLKDVPANEMEYLLLASIPADEQSMRDLAVQRGVAVKDYLAARQVPLERLFLGSARTVPPEAKWSPRAELLLELR